MKQVALFLLTMVTLLSISCSTSPTVFENIEGNKVRTLDFVFKNIADTTLVEGAPGDTMLLYAYFAGEKVQSVSWSVSWNVIKNQYDEDTAIDKHNLEFTEVLLADSAFSNSTDQVGIKFAVPTNLMSLHDWQNDPLIASSGMTPDSLIAIIELLSKTPQPLWGTLGATLGMSSDNLELLKQNLPKLLSILSVHFRIFALVNNTYQVESTVSVRYNRLFKNMENVYVNHNPITHWTGIYKVKGANKTSFDPNTMTSADTLVCLSTTNSSAMGSNTIFGDTLLVDKDYSYFLAADSGRFNGETSNDSALAVQIEPATQEITILSSPEIRNYMWFYSFLPDQASEVESQKLLNISSNGASVTLLNPSRDSRITCARLWLQTFDSHFGEHNRPAGSTLNESFVNFKYTQAYLDYVKKFY